MAIGSYRSSLFPNRDSVSPESSPPQRPRVIVVTRRYWPHVGSDTADTAAAVVADLRTAGAVPRVATPQTRGTGSAEFFTHRETSVRRPMSVPRSDWVAGRYIRQWAAWLQTEAADADAIVAVGCREEAVAAVMAARKLSIPVLLRPILHGPEDDQIAWRGGGSGRRFVAGLKSANHTVVLDAADRRTLIAEGFRDDRLVGIPLAFREPVLGWPPMDGGPASPERRKSARKILGLVNSDLCTDADTVVLWTTSAMVRGGAIESLVAALPAIHAAHPSTRFWLTGDGPARGRLYDQIRGDGLKSVVSMPGSFDHLSELAAACNLYLHLDSHPAVGSLLSIGHSGAKIAALRSAANLQMFEQTESTDTIWFDDHPVEIKRALKAAIADELRDGGVHDSGRLASRARRRMHHRSHAEVIEFWRQMFAAWSRSGSC